MSVAQLELFGSVMHAYGGAHEVRNDDLYEGLVRTGVVDAGEIDTTSPVGRAAQRHSLGKRKVRWIQQTLRQLGVIERVPGRRGVWRAVAKKELDKAPRNLVRVAFSTDLGLALWSDCSAFRRIDEPIDLILSSPPYALSKARAYGGPSVKEYTEFICRAVEPLLRNLVPGGSLCLNLSNDIFLAGTPARSTYLERLTIALEDLGLLLMDRLVWENPSKPPGPTYWACKERVQLVHTWEPVLWMTNDPTRCLADNRRVLRPHSAANSKLIARGGESRSTSYGDGAHRLRPGSFGAETAGTIPRNILRIPHEASSIAPVRQAALDSGLPAHGALMPRDLARFLIEFLTPAGGMVADLFSGWFTTATQAEETGRRWICTEQMAQYVALGAWRLQDAPGFHSSFDLTRA